MTTDRHNIIALVIILAMIVLVVLGCARYTEPPASSVGKCTITPASPALIKELEGFSAVPYKDAHGYSIGHGHFIKPYEAFTSVTREEAHQLLLTDLVGYVRGINGAVNVPLTHYECTALTSLVYNIGVSAFNQSTMLKYINSGYKVAAGAEFKRWVYSEGKVNQGLVARRKIEQEIYYGKL